MSKARRQSPSARPKAETVLDPERFKVLFELRCATRELERQAAFWRRIDALGKLITVFATSGAFAALGKEDSPLIVTAGLALAGAFAFDVVVRPTERAAAAKDASKLYGRPYAAAHRLSTQELQSSLEDARERDETSNMELVRLAAWNDTARELGAAPSETKLSVAERLFRWFT